MDTLSGRLLVATPEIAEGPFWRSVVFLVEHADSGALGVILNQPLNALVSDVLEPWADLVSEPTHLFDGGPVGGDSVLALGVVPDGFAQPGWLRISEHLRLVDLDGPVPAGNTLTALRVFVGHAGWSAGQLEDEIDEGAWFVVDFLDADVGSSDPTTLWRDVLLRQDGNIRLLATFPADVDLN